MCPECNSHVRVIYNYAMVDGKIVYGVYECAECGTLFGTTNETNYRIAVHNAWDDTNPEPKPEDWQRFNILVIGMGQRHGYINPFNHKILQSG